MAADRVVQDFVMTRQNEGFVPVVKLTTTTDAPDYTEQQEDQFDIMQVP
jgi:hypothetical protein